MGEGEVAFAYEEDPVGWFEWDYGSLGRLDVFFLFFALPLLVFAPPSTRFLVTRTSIIMPPAMARRSFRFDIRLHNRENWDISKMLAREPIPNFKLSISTSRNKYGRVEFRDVNGRHKPIILVSA